MKKLLILLLLSTSCVFMTGCGNRNAKKAAQTEEAQQVETIDVDKLLAQAEELNGKEVSIEGICRHICKHGGRKAFLMGSNDTKIIRVEAGEQIGAFTEECVNSLLKVKGTMVEDRIDEAYLTKWEEQVKNMTAENHGEGKEGCDSEKKARGEVASTTAQRIADFRAKIAERKAKEGKEYLSFYHINGISYEILK